MGIVVEAVKPPIDDGDRLWWEYNGADGNQLMAEAFGEGMEHSRERLRKFSGCGRVKVGGRVFQNRDPARRLPRSWRSSWSATRLFSVRRSA